MFNGDSSSAMTIHPIDTCHRAFWIGHFFAQDYFHVGIPSLSRYCFSPFNIFVRVWDSLNGSCFFHGQVLIELETIYLLATLVMINEWSPINIFSPKVFISSFSCDNIFKSGFRIEAVKQWRYIVWSYMPELWSCHARRSPKALRPPWGVGEACLP